MPGCLKTKNFLIKNGIVVEKVKSCSIVEKAKTDSPIKWASSQG